jgi:hypothetical protein
MVMPHARRRLKIGQANTGRQFRQTRNLDQGDGRVKRLSTPLVSLCLCCLLSAEVQAQDEQSHAARRHPPRDKPLHEQFYSTWHMPDHPNVSCCNDADCYPTEIKYIDGKIFAKRREDGKFIPIPFEKVERNRDNPDGRNHLCAPPPSAYRSPDTVFCFALGGAT